MRNEQPLIFALHGLIRSVLMERPVDEAYLFICKAIFPGAVLGQLAPPSGSIDHRYLKRVCDFIYELDKKEWSYTSCYSASITAHIIAFSCDIPSEIAIGVKRQDKKITGHAWLEVEGADETHIINPGHANVGDFQVIKRLKPEATIESWMKNRATLDAALES